jgi:hypothetical protein
LLHKMNYPTNFVTLREEENRIYNDSIVLITSDTTLSDHLEIFHESLNMIFDLTTQYERRSDQDEILQYIGLRLFNSSITAFELMLSGYYQVSFSIQRDALEIRHLLDYFTSFPEKIIEWKASSNADRNKKFKPSLLRDELDKRDGLNNYKRKEEYQRFCEFATHASYSGFKLLRNKNRPYLGPFYKKKWLKHCLEEITTQIVLVTRVYIQHFSRLPKEFEKPIQKYDELFQDWKKKYPHFAQDTVIPPD